MRATTICAALLIACSGCLSTSDPTDDGATIPIAWVDVQAAPEGFDGSEVSIAIDPNDPLHVLAAAHIFTNPPLLEFSFAIYESYDGGETWSADRLTPGLLFGPGSTEQGTHRSLSDPSVAFGPDSTPYIAGLAYIPDSAVFVAKRHDDGTWVAHTVWQSEVAATFNDKEWLAVSPVTGTLLVAWQREPALDSLRTVQAETGVDADVGTILISRSTDQGASWSLPEEISHGLHNNGTQVAFAPDGTAYLCWVDYEDAHFDMLISRDDGTTWGELSVPSDITLQGAYDGFTRMHTLPALAVDDDQQVLVWHDARNGDTDILLAHRVGSEPDGWQVHRVPDGPVGDGNIQFYPWVTVDQGIAHVTFYSARNGTQDFVYRHVAFDAQVGFGPVEDVSQEAFRIFANEENGPADIGDYTGVAALDGHLYAAWAHPTGNDSFIHVGHPAPVS